MFCTTVRMNNREVHGSPISKVFKVTGLVILGIVGAAVLAIIFGLVIQWLWNTLMPEIFGLPEVSYWQAVGLAVLSHILFGSHNHNHNSNGNSCKTDKPKQVNLKGEAAAFGQTLSFNNKRPEEEEGFHKEWDSFRDFWNDYGREAFESWLNRNHPLPHDEEPGN